MIKWQQWDDNDRVAVNGMIMIGSNSRITMMGWQRWDDNDEVTVNGMIMMGWQQWDDNDGVAAVGCNDKVAAVG